MSAAMWLSGLAGRAETVDCLNGGMLYILSEAETEEFDALAAAMAQAQVRSEGAVRLLYGQEAEGVITAAYLPARRQLRAVLQRGEHRPPDREGEAVCTPLLTQLKLSYFTADCGMSYVIRLRDGRFVLIDGGMGSYDEGQQLMELLRAQSPDGTVRIAAWFITHAHDDHMGGLVALAEQYAGQFALEGVYFNWPRPDLCGPSSPTERFHAALARLGAPLYTPRSGQRITFSGVDFDVLYSCEDRYPHPIHGFNNSSLVLRMTAEGRRVLFPGDGEGECAAELCDRFGPETLRCGILQVPHHGYWGGSQELFERVDPETVLWPCPDFWYHQIRLWDCNRFFRESPGIRRIFVGGRETVTLDLTAPAPEPADDRPSTPILRDEDFSHRRMTRLDMSCVTGGSTGYAPARLEFLPQGGARFTADDRPAVIVLLRPGQLAGLEPITLSMEGTLRHREDGTTPPLCGLWVSHPIPQEWSESDLTPLPLHAPLTLSPCPSCGLYLVLRNASVTLTRVRIMS